MKNTLSFVALMAFVALLTAFNGLNKKEKYQVDANSSKLEWVGKKVTGQHNGSIQLKSGELELSKGKLTGGQFEIDMTSITCEDLSGEWNQKLVGHLHSDDFFGVEKYPTTQVQITKVKALSSSSYEVTADLTIKGITKPVSFTANTSESNGTLTATAEIAVDRTAYGIKYGSGSFFDDLGDRMIDDQFTLNVSLKASSSM